MFWIQIALAFVAGIVWSKFWENLVYSGFSILMLKTTQLECLKLYQHANISTELMLDMKYKNLEDSGMDAKKISGEKQLDQHVLSGMRNTMIKVLILSIPRSYLSIAKYSDWDSAMHFLEENK